MGGQCEDLYETEGSLASNGPWEVMTRGLEQFKLTIMRKPNVCKHTCEQTLEVQVAGDLLAGGSIPPSCQTLVS